MNSIKNNLKYLFIVLAFLIPKSSYTQIPDTAYMKVDVSNLNPAVNEPVTITLEFELKKDYTPCQIFLGSADSLK